MPDPFRSRRRATAVAFALFAFLSLAGSPGAEEPFAKSDPPGQLPVLESGRKVDAQGRVPDEARTDVFMRTDDVFLAPQPRLTAGTKVQVEIIDRATDRKVWSTEAEVAPGDAGYFVRIAAGTLEPGHYLARLSAAGGGRIEHGFRVSDARAEGSITD
jgi:hypothetical protein